MQQFVAPWAQAATSLPSFTHVLTHLDWTLHPVRASLPAKATKQQLDALVAGLPPGGWFGLDEALAMGLPAPLRKLLKTAAPT